MLRIGLLPACLVFAMAISSCGGDDSKSPAGDVLVAMGDSTLTLSDVVSRIPVGIDEADSVALFHKIVDNWIEGMVLADMARTKLSDLDRIESMVAEYRNRLIVAEYLKKMRVGKKFKVSSDSVRAFYDAHRAEMVTETPLVKGIYLKVADGAGAIDEIRRCVFDASGASIDELEKKWAGDAIQYDYFENEWIDWTVIADQIPYRFYDPDAFLASTVNFETSCNGSTYFLHIGGYLPSGSETPFEFASPRISSLLEQAKMASYEEALVNALIKKAMSENNLVAVGYDPLSRKYLGFDTIKRNDSVR